MTDYRGPVKDTLFVLRELAGPIEAEIEQAIAHGAGGLILVSTRLDKELRAKEFPADDLESIVEAAADGIPVVELTQDGFKRLLATAGYTPADLKTGPPVMQLDLRLLLEAPLEWQAQESANVVGLLPSSDPVLKNEILILAADVRRGDSGSAVVDPSGRVVGVLFAVAPDRPATAYALDVAELRRLLDDPRDPSTSSGACS